MAHEDFEFPCPACGGQLLGSPVDVGQTMQCSYQCTYANGRTGHASGTWNMRNRSLVFTVQSNTSISPFGNTTLLHMDVSELNGVTLHLQVKDGVQYWKHL